MKTTLETVLDEINMVMEASYTEEHKDTPLAQLNIDSLDAVEVQMELEERFPDTEFPDEGLLKYTPQQIAEMVKGGGK